MALQRKALASSTVCALANRHYNATTDAGRSAFYHRYAKICRGHIVRFGCKEWCVDVPPFHIRMPLRNEEAWLDWDLALSILGHDAEIIDFYAKVLRSEFRPDVFVDIGANYGAHTALFASAGVQCVAFEPNAHCLDYIRQLMEMNHLTAYKLEPIALADTAGNAQLTFPSTDTWLGSITQDQWDGKVITVSVPVRRLDDVEIPEGLCLAKIDTEGSELSIIRGARIFLRERCGSFVFEAAKDSDREGLFAEISSIGFSIEALPLDDLRSSHPLDEESFINARGWNFVARQSSHTA